MPNLKRSRRDSSPDNVARAKIHNGRQIVIIDLNGSSSSPRFKKKESPVYPSINDIPDPAPRVLTSIPKHEGKQSALTSQEIPDAPKHISAAAQPPMTVHQVHSLIDSMDLGVNHRCILKYVTYIPWGRYTTLTQLKEWVWGHRGLTNIRTLECALEKSCTTYGLPLHYVPVHRVIQSSRASPDWWSHIAEDVNSRRALLEAEGIHFDCYGRAMGQPWQLPNGHELEVIIGCRFSPVVQERRLAEAWEQRRNVKGKMPMTREQFERQWRSWYDF